MGGKSYFCDYCKCYMKNDINVRKTHNSGLIHQNQKARHFRPYEDPAKILVEETTTKKAKCSHYFRSFCKFDMICQYSHYSDEQLEKLRKLVQTQNNRKENKKQRRIYDSTSTNQVTPQFLRTKSVAKKLCKNLKLKIEDLPPSLKPIKFNKAILQASFNNEWGS